VTLDDQVVEVAALVAIEAVEAKVVADYQRLLACTLY